MDAPRTMVEVYGPAAWYSNTYPVIVTSDGKGLSWHSLHLARRYVVLSEADRKEFPRIGINTHTRLFMVSDRCFGLIGREAEEIVLAYFDAADLEEFDARQLPHQARGRETTYFAVAQCACSTRFSASLKDGVIEHDFPAKFREIGEILIPVGYSHVDAHGPAAAIFSLRPAASEIHVYPQYWFTAATMDIGYQWIARERRDARTGRIHGDGIRIAPFVLAEDHCNLEIGRRFTPERIFGS